MAYDNSTILRRLEAIVEWIIPVAEHKWIFYIQVLLLWLVILRIIFYTLAYKRNKESAAALTRYTVEAVNSSSKAPKIPESERKAVSGGAPLHHAPSAPSYNPGESPEGTSTRYIHRRVSKWNSSDETSTS